jgi:large subunit ribosomal protein L32
MRHTRATTGDRRSHHAIKSVRLSKCEKCGVMRPSHRVCLSCGNYRGKQVIDVLAKLGKREQKTKAKAEAGKK